ncbi:MarR family winged helix-turn-helix transcriptional regulator [Agrobacterium tumefaciens]|uniref:MarR family winged helix-turn-helix transcriptional regulator n=1 Tax=Agrobacterium tumefaciens TaxID=358 RepID=UPI00287BF85D|nr:MarR family winged helix-turn-helix transcriptional regulator [Agrobacterium tumefaciens]MDS7594326.1 MarR family winged helix-turn-helix transcriptional regulator [Agrobacterium tumefaciens]
METPNNPTPIYHRIREGLARVAMVMRADDWTRAKRTGINPAQLSILELLEGREGGLGVKDIAVHLGVSQPTATDSISALERKGYVEKRADKHDKRGIKVALSDVGLSALRAADTTKGAADHATRALGDLEQEELLVMLVKLIRHLQEQDAIPIQRMCVTCRYFAPFAYPDAAQPHHCKFVDAAFGQRDLRIDCRDHEAADAPSQAATWDAFVEK